MPEMYKPKNSEFQVHLLNEIGIARANAIAQDFDELLEKLKEYCLPTREMSIVRTKLEEASFFAKKAMANNPINQKASSPKSSTGLGELLEHLSTAEKVVK